MDVQTPSPQTTLTILLGASAWPDSPDFPGSKAFAHAVTGFRKYLFAPDLFGLPKENALDLFDVYDSPYVIDSKIRRFLEHRTSEMKQSGNAARDLLVYFVGHGAFVGGDSEYYLAMRCASTENLRLSAIPIESLASTLTDKARYLRRIIILDCCYAAAAFTAFQAEGPARLGINQTVDAFKREAKTVGKGTALLCSSGKTVASQIAPDESCTMFSKALLQVLLTGNGDRGEQPYLSLREVAELTEEVIETVLERRAPRPEVHSPDQKDGDVALVPFFPNPAARGAVALQNGEVLRFGGTPSERATLLPTFLPSKEAHELRSISRRTLLRLGLGGAGVAALAGGGFAWLAASHRLFRPGTVNTPSLGQASTPVPQGTLFYTYRGHSDWVSSVDWSPDGRHIASGSHDKTVQVWNAANGGYIFTYRGHLDIVNAIDWSPDGTHIASGGDDHTVQVWNAITGGHDVFTYRQHTDIVNAVAWSPDGRHIASGSWDLTVQVWDIADGARVLNYQGHSQAVLTVDWSPNSQRIASGGYDHTVQVWDALTGGNVFTYHGHSDNVQTVTWSPDGKHIASGGYDKTVRVWNAVDGSLVYAYRGHSDSIWSVAWSPNGTRIASASADKTVHVWDATTGDHVFIYLGHSKDPSGNLNTVAWSPDGRRIASGGDDNVVQVWEAT